MHVDGTQSLHEPNVHAHGVLGALEPRLDADLRGTADDLRLQEHPADTATKHEHRDFSTAPVHTYTHNGAHAFTYVWMPATDGDQLIHGRGAVPGDLLAHQLQWLHLVAHLQVRREHQLRIAVIGLPPNQG